jgi:hypothetical protein
MTKYHILKPEQSEVVPWIDGSWAAWRYSAKFHTVFGTQRCGSARYGFYGKNDCANPIAHFETTLIFMAVTVSPNPSDCRLQMTARPVLGNPTVVNGSMHFACSPIRLHGSVTLHGSPGDSAKGWRAGFLQAQWVETNWSSYRGLSNTDGSMFIQRSRPPARSQRACRDCTPATPLRDIFYSTDPVDGEIATGKAGDTFPLVLNVKHYDSPADGCPLLLKNSLTQKENLLREAQFEFLFCAVLTVQDPNGAFRHVMAVYWNTRWHFQFGQPGNRPTVIPAGTGSVVGTPFRVGHGQIDRRFASVLTSRTEYRSCNDIFRSAYSAFDPGSPNRHESRTWIDFNVTAP